MPFTTTGEHGWKFGLKLLSEMQSRDADSNALVGVCLYYMYVISEDL
jgi:hypothetical protein